MKTFFEMLVAASLVFSAAVQSNAYGNLSSVSAGYSSQQAMGNNYQTLGRAGGFQASATYDLPTLGSDLRLRGSFNYHSHSVKNLTDGKIGFFGTYVGVEAGQPIPKSQFHLQPNLGFELGLVYDNLSLPGGSTVTNSAMLFGARIVPGIRTSLIQNVLFGLEFPISWTFSKNNLTTWSGIFNLGWAL
jgi:hypothetical protein